MESKPFFFRIDLTELYDFATEPEGVKMSLLKFAKELKKGHSDYPQIQRIIDEANEFIAKKSASGKKAMEIRYKDKPEKQKKANTVITPLSTVITHPNDDITSSSNSNNSSTEAETKTEALRPKTLKPGNGKFIPPTLEEVRIFCEGRKNNIDPEGFFHHYEARNWIPKGYTKQMTSWKSTIITWEKNNNGSNRPGSSAKETGRKAGFVEANGPEADWLGDKATGQD